MPTCNPPLAAITATMSALRAQTLPLDQWELILVDNNSKPPLDDIVDLSWHPRARYCVELVPGLLPARSRGLRESSGELVISVDDDNILNPDYLAVALRLSQEHPRLGVWGGSIEAEYDGAPPAWVRRFAYHLAISTFENASWSSFVHDRSNPYGASMCIRREVVDVYLERLEKENLSRYGRNDRGANTSFVGAEDQLIGYTASLLGYSIGRFPELQLRHRIDRKRYNPEYFLKMVRGNAHGALLVQIQHRNCPAYRAFLMWPIMKFIHACLRERGMDRRVMCAEARGELDALLEARRQRVRIPVLPAAAGNPGASRPPTSAAAFDGDQA